MSEQSDALPDGKAVSKPSALDGPGLHTAVLVMFSGCAADILKVAPFRDFWSI
jgi:hypothetical protein